MINPSGVTHDMSVPGKALRTEQLAIMNDLKELLTDTSKKNRKAFIVCHHSTDGRHDYHPVTEKTIPMKKLNGENVMVNCHFSTDKDGRRWMHYMEKCANKECGKVRYGSDEV